MNVLELLDKGYKIGMVQEREEVLGLGVFLISNKPHNVLEIGCKLGGTFEMLCNVATGKKISIDLPGGIHGGWMMKDHPYLGDAYKLRNEYFERTYPNVVMLTGDSHKSQTYHNVRDVLGGEKIDFLFIDGDHTYEGVKQDFEMYRQLVNPGGWICFHDINDTPHHREIDVWVGKFWKELPGKVKIEFNANKHWAGIGILQYWPSEHE